jgi:DNA-binding response OmpR family regulator
VDKRAGTALYDAIARVKALLRRATGEASPRNEAGPLRLDPAALELHAAGAVHRVTPLESRLLQLLLANAGQPVSTEQPRNQTNL